MNSNRGKMIYRTQDQFNKLIRDGVIEVIEEITDSNIHTVYEVRFLNYRNSLGNITIKK